MPNLVLVNIAAGPMRSVGHNVRVTIGSDVVTLNFGASSIRPMPNTDKDLRAESSSVIGVGKGRGTLRGGSPDLRLFIFELHDRSRLSIGEKKTAVVNLPGLEHGGFNGPITTQIRNLIG